MMVIEVQWRPQGFMKGEVLTRQWTTLQTFRMAGRGDLTKRGTVYVCER